MPRKSSTPVPSGHDRYLYAGISLYVTLVWSWLFTVRISELSGATAVGYLCALAVFLVIVGATAVVYVRVAWHFLETYRRQETPTPWFLVKLFVVWSAAEWTMSVGLALIWMGPQGSLDTVLPLGSLTPLLMYTPLRFLVRLVGFHGLSALVIVLAAALAGKKLRRYAPAAIGGSMVVLCILWLAYRKPTGPPVQTTVVAEALQNRLPPLQTSADLVVLPEYGLDGIRASDMSTRITPTDKDVFFVGSQRVYTSQPSIQNVLVFGASNQGFVQEQPKSRLIPGGEYLPYGLELPLRALGQSKALEEFRVAEAITKGKADIHTFRIKDDVILGSAACASIISTKDYQAFVRDGATVLTNSASLAPFSSSLFMFQHQGLARFMATANARPFLQSSNSAEAFALDHNGHLLKKISPVSSADVTVQANTKSTPYTFLGEWPVYAGLVLLAFGAARRLKKRLHKHK